MPLQLNKSIIFTSSCLSSSPQTFFSCCLSSSIFSDQIHLRAIKMMKAVLKLDLHDDKDKKKAMRRVSGLPGVESISMDMKDMKLTVVGNIDAVNIVAKLRKICHTDIISVGPAKEPEKKKEEPKKPEDDKKDKDVVAEWVKAYQAYNPYLTTHYHVRSVEEDPNACVIS